MTVKGVVSVGDDGSGATLSDELNPDIDSARAERYGVSSSVIANTVAYALRSPLLAHAEERDVDVNILYRKQDREELERPLDFKVPTDGAWCSDPKPRGA